MMGGEPGNFSLSGLDVTESIEIRSSSSSSRKVSNLETLQLSLKVLGASLGALHQKEIESQNLKSQAKEQITEAINALKDSQEPIDLTPLMNTCRKMLGSLEQTVEKFPTRATSNNLELENVPLRSFWVLEETLSLSVEQTNNRENFLINYKNKTGQSLRKVFLREVKSGSILQEIKKVLPYKEGTKAIDCPYDLLKEYGVLEFELLYLSRPVSKRYYVGKCIVHSPAKLNSLQVKVKFMSTLEEDSHLLCFNANGEVMERKKVPNYTYKEQVFRDLPLDCAHLQVFKGKNPISPRLSLT